MANLSKKKGFNEANNKVADYKREKKKDEITLKNMVYSGESSKRKEAALWLVEEKHFDEEYFNLLKRLIKDEEEEVWKAATIALGKCAFKDVNAYNYLCNLLGDVYFWVQKRGIHALGEFAKFDHRGMDVIKQLASTNRRDVVEEVVEVLRNVAAQNDDAYNILVGLLRSKEELIVQPAIYSIGVLASEKNEALKELIPLLKEDNNFIRLWAASAIGEAARYNDKAFTLYKSFIDDKDVYLRRGFSKGLVSISKNRPKEALRLIDIAVKDSDKYVRVNAAQSLGPITTKNEEAFIKVHRLLNDNRSDVRRGAAEALLNVADEIQGELLPLMRELAKDEDYYLRSVAAFASVKMAATSPKDAIDLLEMLVEDKDEYVRRDVALALGELPPGLAEYVFPYLKKLMMDRESIVKKETRKSLMVAAKIKTNEILDLMPELTNDFDEGVRENAAEVLGEIAESNPQIAFDYLSKLVQDDSPRVREKVAKSLEKVFDLEPESFFVRIRALQKDGISSEILGLIGRLARNEEIGKVSLLYAMLMNELDEANVESRLNRALGVLEGIKTLKNSEDIKNVFKTLLHGVRTSNINDMALLKFDYKPLIEGQGGITDADSEMFNMLEELSEMALRYKQIEELSDKHIYLGKMLSSIDGALKNIQEENLPDAKIHKQVLLNWRGVLSHTMDGLKGKAALRIGLRTKKVLPLDTLTLLLGLENTGESLAENLVVEVMPSPSYKIVDKTKKIRMLPHQRKDSVEFRIKPKENDDFRVEFNISYDDFEMKGKSSYFADKVSFIDIPREFKYIPNPYITGGPIKPISKGMFFGRDDVFEFIRNNISSLSQKNVLILQGERRTGKTSILYQVQDILGPEYICVFLDGQEFGSATLDYLFYRISKLISNALGKNGMSVSLPERKAFKEDPWYVFKDQFLENVSNAIGNKYLVILFDEFEALEHAVRDETMDPVIFDYIRNLMQHEEKLVFIFAGLHRLEEMMQDYWGVLFNIAMYWKISLLEESEAKKLITRPVEGYNLLYDDLAIEKIIRATACHPYFVQLLCRFLVNRHNTEERNYITVQDVNEELVNVVEKAKPHFNYIWTLSSLHERILLAILPEILRKKNIATVTDIIKECEENKIHITRTNLSSALNSLTAKDIMERASNGEVHYRFKVDFIRMWVEKHQPLSKVIEEHREELRGK